MNIRFAVFVFCLFTSLLSSAQTGCVKGNCNNGEGTFVYENGDQYEGTFANGKKQRGRLTYKNGGYYTGYFVNEVPEGYGKTVLANGTEYSDGYYTNGKLDGRIKKTDSAGIVYTELWKDGVAIRSHKLDACIDGDCQNGTGTYVWSKIVMSPGASEADYVTYIGEWKNGRRHGKGKFFNERGDIIQGDFADDQPHGTCTMVYFKGEKHTGQYENGVCVAGTGTMLFPSISSYSAVTGKTTYASFTGTWKNGKKVGDGKLTLSNGSTYEGSFDDIKMDAVFGDFEKDINGKGKYTDKKGDQYIGEFEKCVINGEGTALFANGDVYQGEFRNGLFHGTGLLAREDGRINSGKWKDGLIVKPDERDNASGTAKEIREFAREQRRAERERQREAEAAAKAEIEAHKCQECGGLGYVFTKKIEYLNDFGRVVKTVDAGETTCRVCHGTGKR